MLCRPEVHEAYWHLAVERQRVLERRLAGEAPPWTDDEIITRYRFTNPWRASDRVSQFLISEVIYRDAERLPPEDQLARIVLFRLFSRPATWAGIEEALGPVRARTLFDSRLPAVLERLRAQGPLYTGAFILCANRAYGHPRKHLNHVALVQDMLRRGGLSRAVARARGLRDVYLALKEYPLVGPFMGYQLAIDVNYSELTAFSEDEFTVPGPGAERGIRKVFPHATRREMPGIIQRMVEEQESRCRTLGLLPPRLLGRRRLHAIDCQNLFCELDKYARVRFPELLSARRQIKAVFKPSPEPLRMFLPPKWGLAPTA